MDKVIDLVSSDEEDRQALSRRKRKRKKIADEEDIDLSADANGAASPSKSTHATTDSGSEDLSSEDSDVESGSEAEDDDEESAGSSGDVSTVTDSDSDESSECSTGSEDEVISWDEFNYLGEGNSNDSFVSPEVEEERLKERFSEAMRLLFNENSHQQGFDSLTALLEEPLIAAQRVPDLSIFDWAKAKSEYIRSCEPKLRMIAFGINRALARFADPCIGFYLQALALRPVDKALWYEFGCAAAKSKEWKTAEMAFLECQNDPNAVMKLATVYFYAKEYHKCLPLLKQILDRRPQNVAALVLKAEITKLNNFWKLFVDFFFPTNPLLLPLPEVPKDVYQKVLAEMVSFTNSDDEESAKSFESTFSVRPLPADSIKIAMDRTSEDFAKFICDYFDQSTAQQVPFGQQVHFTRDKRHSSTAQETVVDSDSDDSVHDESPGPSNVPDEDEDIDDDLVITETVDDMVVIVDVVRKLLDDVDVLLATKPKTRKQKKKKRDHVLDVRRSTRNADDVPLEALESPVNARPKNSDFLTLRILLGLPEGTNPALDFPGASGHALEDYTVDLIPPYCLETFNGYLTILLNNGEMSMEELLHSYLSFFATSLPAGCVMTEAERRLFLEIYTRWESTFCRPLQQCCYTASPKDMAIHVTALELDPTGLTAAKIACQLIFDNPFGFGRAFDVVSADSGDADVVPSTVKEDTTLKGLRKRAITLLEEVDPPMAAKVKISLDAARIANKAVTREHNLEAAVGNVAFSSTYYRPVAQPLAITAKDTSHANSTSPIEVVEVTRLSNEPICLNTSDDKVASTSDDVVPSTSALPSIDCTDFVPLWMELSTALKQHRVKQATATMVPVESSESLMSMDSPLSEDQLLDVLADVANGLGSPMETDTLSGLAEEASRNDDLKALLSEYMTHLAGFVGKVRTEGLAVFDKPEWTDFVEETRQAVAAMQVVTKTSEPESSSFPSRDNELQNTLVARYLWLQYVRQKNSDASKGLLAALINLLDVNTPIYTQLVDVEPADRIITAIVVSKLLTSVFRTEKTAEIQKLFDAGHYDEVISELTTDFNWNCCTTAELIANLRLLLAAFRAVGDGRGAVIYLCRMLDKIIASRDGDADRDAVYADCLDQLNALDFNTIDEASVEAVARCLLVCTEYNRFNQNVTLWKVLYKVVSALEPEYDDNSRLEFFKDIEDYPRAMPTKALCVISECHNVLINGKCIQNEGEFLYFAIDEIYRVCGKTPLSDVVLSYSIGKTIQRNVEGQVLQCLRCLIDKNIARNALFDHGVCVEAKATVDLACKVIPVLLRQLPMFDDVPKATVDTIDTICRIFSFIETIQPEGLSEAMEAFEAHLKSPPFFWFTAGDGIQLVPQGDLSNAYNWPCVAVTEEVKQLAYLRYALLVLRYRRSKGDDLDEIRKLAKECLVLVGPAEREILPVQFVHSLWALYALTSASAFSSLNDPDLLNRFPWQFYLFKMAFLLYPRGFQLHLDVVNVYYHVHARLNRYIASLKKDSTERKEARAALDREKVLDQCQLHLDTFRHKITLTNEYPCDISWLEGYFSGKIAEKRKAAAKDVFEHYYRCALLMRVEKYIYPLRIGRTRQEHAETLEIHYRVHTFALKRIRKLDKEPTSAKSVAEILDIRDYLRLFLGHFFFASKPLPANLPTISGILPFVRTMPPYGDFEDKESVFATWREDSNGVAAAGDDVGFTISSLTQYVDAKTECIELAKFAYESIFKRFPHYKSIYRLAELQSLDKNSRGVVDTIMRLYNGPGKLHFESITEFIRTDFERSGSLSYHLGKLILLLTESLLKTPEVDTHRVAVVLTDLAKYPEWQKVAISEDVRTKAIRNCLATFYQAMETASKDNSKLVNLLKQLNKIYEEQVRIQRSLDDATKKADHETDAEAMQTLEQKAKANEVFSKFMPLLKALIDKISQYQQANLEAAHALNRAHLAKMAAEAREREAQRQREEAQRKREEAARQQKVQQQQQQQLQQVLLAALQKRLLEEQAAKKQQEEAEKLQKLQAAKKRQEDEERMKLAVEALRKRQQEETERAKKTREAAEIQQKLAAQKAKRQLEEAEKAKRAAIQEEKFKKAQEALRAKKKQEADDKMRYLQQQADLARKKKEEDDKRAKKALADAAKQQQINALLQAATVATSQGATTDQFEILVRQQIELAESQRLQREQQQREAEARGKMKTPAVTTPQLSANNSPVRPPTANGTPRKPRRSSEEKKREREEKLKQQREHEDRIRSTILQPVVNRVAEEERKREEDRLKKAQEAAATSRKDITEQMRRSILQQQHDANALLMQVRIKNFIDQSKEFSPELKIEMQNHVNAIVNEILEASPENQGTAAMTSILKYKNACETAVLARQRTQSAQPTPKRANGNVATSSKEAGNKSTPAPVPTTSTSQPNVPSSAPPPPNQNLLAYPVQPTPADRIERQLMAIKVEKLLRESVPRDVIANMDLKARPLQYLKDTFKYIEYGKKNAVAASSSSNSSSDKVAPARKPTPKSQTPATSVSSSQIGGFSGASTLTPSTSTPSGSVASALRQQLPQSNTTVPFSPSPNVAQRKRPANEAATPIPAPKVSRASNASQPSTPKPPMNGFNAAAQPSTSTSFPHNFPSLAQQVAKAIPTRSDDDIVILKEVKPKQRQSSSRAPSANVPPPSNNHLGEVIDSVVASTVSNRAALANSTPQLSTPSRATASSSNPIPSRSLPTSMPPNFSQTTTQKSLNARGLPINQSATSAYQLPQQTPPSVSAQNQNPRLPQLSGIDIEALRAQLRAMPGALQQLPEQQRQQILNLLQQQGANVR